MPQQILTQERWCKRCDDYTDQTRDVPNWRVSSRALSILVFPYNFFEDLFAVWFCEKCRRTVRPFWFRLPTRPPAD